MENSRIVIGFIISRLFIKTKINCLQKQATECVTDLD